MRVVFRFAGYGGLGPEFAACATMGFSEALDALSALIAELAPARSGSLRRSVGVAERGAARGRIVVAADYASFVEYGTGIYGPSGRAYEVRPTGRRALHWAGARHPVARVTIGGMRPRGFVARAVLEADYDGAFGRGFGAGR